MASINMHIRYEKKIVKRFTRKSIFAGRLSKAYDLVGAQTVKLSTIKPVPLNDYNRGASANRFGTPTDVGDTVQELTMTQLRSFSAVLDKTYAVDQAINKAGEFLTIEMDEVLTPERDAYTLNELAQKAGKIVGSNTAIDKTNVFARVNAARAYMNSHKVPMNNRTWYVASTVYSALIECDHFKDIEKLGYKAVVTGQVGQLFGAPVIEVPDDLMPAGVNFVLVYKESALDPIKLKDTNVHTNPPGYSGTLVEGAYYYGAFVLGERSDGVYVDVDTTVATVAALPTVGADGKITLATGCSARYTTDGSDPRYSDSAVTISATTAAGVGSVGNTIRAYQYKTGAFASGVAEAVRTA